jgi:hypothetical protein
MKAEGERAKPRRPLFPPRFRELTQPGPCGLCGDPAYLADHAGPVHPCCAANALTIAMGQPCPACAASRAAARWEGYRRR